MADAPKRLRIAVLYGGRSAEHEVSLMSATNVMAALDPARYDALPVYVTRDGRWLAGSFENGALARPEGGEEICPVPGGAGRVLALAPGGAARELPPLDLIFPVLHGLHGEDGAGCKAIRAEVQKHVAAAAADMRAASRDFDKREMSDGGNVHRLVLQLVNEE